MSERFFKRFDPDGPGNPLGTRLGRKLLGWLLLLSLAPLLLSNMLGYLESLRLIESLVERNLRAIAGVEAQHVRDQVSRVMLGLEMTAGANESFVAAAAGPDEPGTAAETARPLVREVEGYLERKLDETWEFDGLFLQRTDGRVVASAGELPDDLPPLDDTRDESGIRILDSATAAGQARFRLLAPLHDDEFEAVGYLGAIMGPRGLGGLLEIPAHLAGSIESFVLDHRGRPLFVSHPHGPLAPGSSLESPLLETGTASFLRYPDRQGVDVFGIVVPIQGLGWQYLAEFPVDAALGPLRWLRRVFVIFGTGFAALLVLTAWFVVGGIVAPVRRFVRAVRRVGKGDLEVRVDATGKDEIGELGRAFNEMAVDLSAARASVDELHRREIERAQQLATVGELASGVAHEIKNPVVGIANGLDLVRRRIGEEGGLGPIMDEMSRQLDRIELAVRDLLAFARPATPEPVPTDANQIVERAARLIEPAADRSRVSVIVETQPTLPSIRGDPELLGQALVNLAMNAVQATPGGGRVTISTCPGSDPDEVLFRVADTGKGIPDEVRDEIFKPFYTTRHSGSGLGLSISREIVERHGGRIELETEVGRGSVFTLAIPVARERATPARREAAG